MAKRSQIEISPDLKSLCRDTAEKLREVTEGNSWNN